jgi:YVTN family beta-propeller protein
MGRRGVSLSWPICRRIREWALIAPPAPRQDRLRHAGRTTIRGNRLRDLGGTDLFVLDAATHKEIKRIDVAGGAAGIQMSPDGSRAFVAVGSQNGVAVVDLKTLAVTARIATGPGPDGLAWAVLK